MRLAIEPVEGTAEGIDGPAFAVTAGGARTVVGQDEIPVDCGGRVAKGCRLGVGGP